MQKRKTTGLILGKFLPPHLGHQYLADFARNYVDELIVVVGTRPEDPIPGQLRIEWMKEMVPQAKHIHVIDQNPVETHPHYWDIWENTLRNALPYIPDYLFASENYGWKLADIMKMKYIPVNHARSLVPISGTMIRNHPLKYWQYLPPVVRPYYLKKVCIFGAESTGKTMLTIKLARYFSTVYCEEYARGLIELLGNKVLYRDVEKFARGQKASEAALSRQANRILFCDTDIITNSIWSDALFQKTPEFVKQETDKHKYDLYLVPDIDTPWVDDNQRFFPTKRKWFLNKCLHELNIRNINYKMVSGSWDDRFNQAVKYINPILHE
jgi:HTH-type transcriptional regulator, transcriptional repressor of NAD biosynthesis genes